MKKADLKEGIELIEKRPSKHTSKLHQIIILGLYTGYSYTDKRSYTYFTCKTKGDTFYPAANSSDRSPKYLDGVIGSITLKDLRKSYKVA